VFLPEATVWSGLGNLSLFDVPGYAQTRPDNAERLRNRQSHLFVRHDIQTCLNPSSPESCLSDREVYNLGHKQIKPNHPDSVVTVHKPDEAWHSRPGNDMKANLHAFGAGWWRKIIVRLSLRYVGCSIVSST
jgi:hypothetical protein